MHVLCIVYDMVVKYKRTVNAEAESSVRLRKYDYL